jgi:ribosomal protein S18 acetylase RimI-like enzyme
MIIRPASFPADKQTVHNLFLAYAESLPINLSFQNFEQEIADLPGKYAAENGGAVFLASTSPSASPPTTSQPQPQPIGCIAIRPFSPPSKCELKRLYVSPSFRGLGVGNLLLDAAVQRARELGYKEILLDTLGSMTAAMRMYERAGFERVGAYYESVEGAVFYRLVL